MRLKAVLGIKSGNGAKLIKYRIQDLDEENKSKDIPITTIINIMQTKDVQIEGLQLKGNEIKEKYEIPKIPELKENSINLYDWCLQNGKRGQRILEEFNSADNKYIKATDIASSSHMKMMFRCTTCQRISEQVVSNKTSENDCKCKHCAGQSGETSLLDWCNSGKSGEYGKILLQEYMNGNNSISPDKISYGSSQKAYFKCNNCGSINYEKISDRTSKKRKHCIKCDKTGTSFGEQILFRWLLAQGIEAKNQKYFESEAGWKYFDIYIPALNLVIEHQSNLHKLIDKDMNDQLGEIIAQQNGINHLEVCCIDSKYIRQENNWCITYKYGHEPEMINKISQWLLKNYNIQTNPKYDRALENEAYLASCTVKKEESLLLRNPTLAKEWYQPLNGKITPNKVSLNANRKYYWQCPICGHIYLSTPHSRNCSGTACPNYRQHKK